MFWPRYSEMLVPEWNCWSPGILQRTADFPLLPSARTVWTARSAYCTSEAKHTEGICQFFSFSHQVNNSNDDYEFNVEFTKNSRGLGFTISTYTGNLNSGNGILCNQFLNVSALRNYKHILTRVSGVRHAQLFEVVQSAWCIAPLSLQRWCDCEEHCER